MEKAEILSSRFPSHRMSHIAQKAKQPRPDNIAEKIGDIRLDITWSKIARRYFGKSASWLYNKLNGIDGNGGEGGFTDAEREQLREALHDFADRVRRVADSIA